MQQSKKKLYSNKDKQETG